MSKPGPKPSVSDDEILAVFRASDQPVLTAREVAAELVIGRRAVHDRLVDLHDRGMLERKDVGPRGAVWWLPEDAGAGDWIAADDPLFTGDPLFASGTAETSERVDEALYDDPHE